MPYSNRLVADLAERNIRPSLQRLMILDYLRSKRNHPTAEQIYEALLDSAEPISRATVYNTLALFEKKGLLQALSVGESERRYDATVQGHGHFLCEACGRVWDFFMDLDDYAADLPEGFEIRRKGVYFTGLCQQCAQQTKKEGPNGSSI